MRWLDEGPEAERGEVTRPARGRGEPAAERAWLATQNREERQRTSVYTTAEMIVARLRRPARRRGDRGRRLHARPTLLDGGANTLYLCAPLHEQERLRTLFSMMVQELFAVVYETSRSDRQAARPAAPAVLDEAANIAPIPNLDEIASTGAGQGVQLLTVFQDLAQVSARYGRRAPTIVNNHRAKVFGTGISDPETLPTSPGSSAPASSSSARQHGGREGRRSQTEGDTYRDLAPANLVRERDPAPACSSTATCRRRRSSCAPGTKIPSCDGCATGSAPRRRGDEQGRRLEDRGTRARCRCGGPLRARRRRAAPRSPRSRCRCAWEPSGSSQRNAQRGCASSPADAGANRGLRG